MNNNSPEAASFENSAQATDLQIVMMVAAAMAELRSRSNERDPGTSLLERGRPGSR
jgi:hypothetical protein